MWTSDTSSTTSNKLEDDAPEQAVSVPESADTGEGGKLKMIVQLVKKCLGVKDIASMRLSLPASLLEPIPNLEYWHYLDRPDFFAAINDSDDPFMRMLAVIRFTFTKELKFVHGKVVKPYNSVLGEHFRAHWDVVPTRYHVEDTAEEKQRDSSSLRSGKSGISSMSKSKSTNSTSTAGSSTSSSTNPTQPGDGDDLTAGISSLNLAPSGGGERQVRVVYLTEQVSHHPPVSAYFATCPDRQIEMLGIDQISAKVSGTTIRVSPGEYNRGVFIRLKGGPGEGERYRITHPVASVNGILRGNFYVTVGESVVITCEGGRDVTGGDGEVDGEGKSRFRAIIEYKEESWLGRAHFLLEGVVHLVYEGDGERCEEWTKVKHVPTERVVACFEGSWRGGIKWRRVGAGLYAARRKNENLRSTASSPSPSHVKLPIPPMPLTSASRTEFASIPGFGSAAGVVDEPWMPLMDVSALPIMPKVVRPLEKQHPRESRRLWENVTDKLMKKEYSEATREKVQIEQRQRDEAAERKRNGVEFIPRYFEKTYDRGWAELTEEGKLALEEELKEESGFCFEGSGVDVALAS